MNIEQSNENWPRWHVATWFKISSPRNNIRIFCRICIHWMKWIKSHFCLSSPARSGSRVSRVGKRKSHLAGENMKYMVGGKYKIQTLPKLPQGCDHPASWQSCYPSQMKICKTNGDKKQQVWYKSHLGEIYFSQTLTKARKSLMFDACALECATHYIIWYKYL